VSAAAIAGDGPGGSHSRSRRPPRAEATRGETIALGVMAALAAIALSAIVLKEATAVRTLEASLSGLVVRGVTGSNAGSSVGAPVVWFAEGPHRYMGLFITPDCTIAPLIIPFMAATAWVAWRRVMLVRPLIGLAVAVGLLVALNQFRLLLIIMLTVRFGYKNGFYWGHTLIGSLVTVFGVVLIFVFYILVVIRRKRAPARPAGVQ
jgi:exosortase/archaeosortase family protein